jgi:Fic family protein
MLKSLVDGLQPSRLDSPAILKKLVAANRHLAELKGVAASIPNQGILIGTLGLQEAKESSAIENIGKRVAVAHCGGAEITSGA